MLQADIGDEEDWPGTGRQDEVQAAGRQEEDLHSKTHWVVLSWLVSFTSVVAGRPWSIMNEKFPVIDFFLDGGRIITVRIYLFILS